MSEEITAHDSRTRRCPRLGHDVPFSYCRAPGSDTPCRRIFDCWWEQFDVKGFIHRHYDARTIEMILGPPTDKRVSLYQLIQRAQQTTGRREADE